MLTPTQARLTYDVQRAVMNREIVFLSGQQNGKTRVFSRAQEQNAQMQGAKIVLRKRSSHVEDNDAVYVRDLTFPRSDKITIPGFLRQVLITHDIKPKMYSVEVVAQYRKLLNEYRAKHQVMCFAFDNCELIPELGYTVLKYANEFRDDCEDIGAAVLLSGVHSRMRMPFEFWKRTVEISVGKIDSQQDIIQMIETHHPGMSRIFTQPALERIAGQRTTLEQMDAIRRAIQKAHKLRQDEIPMESIPLPRVIDPRQFVQRRKAA